MKESAATNIANTIADEAFGQAASIEAVVVGSCLLLNRNDMKAIKRRATASMKAVRKALQESDFMEARRIISSADWTPKTLWWCITRDELVDVLAVIYARLISERKPDAYLLNLIHSRVVLLTIWDD